MKRHSTFPLLLLLMVLSQLVIDHMMRTMLRQASFLFVLAVEAGAGLLALAIVKLIAPRNKGA
jgi:hypothetical protein